MRHIHIVALAAHALIAPVAAFAADAIRVIDPYILVSSPMAKAGAAFMTIENTAAAEDRLIAARIDVAERAELHTHRQDAGGVMQMVHVHEGFAIPAAGSHALDRGGDHIMLLGLLRALAQGERIDLTLVFEKAGEIVVSVPVGEPSGDGAGGHGHDHGH
jgi:copper(I)-binding protein